jgi:hypothetical protein
MYKTKLGLRSPLSVVSRQWSLIHVAFHSRQFFSRRFGGSCRSAGTFENVTRARWRFLEKLLTDFHLFSRHEGSENVRKPNFTIHLWAAISPRMGRGRAERTRRLFRASGEESKAKPLWNNRIEACALGFVASIRRCAGRSSITTSAQTAAAAHLWRIARRIHAIRT